MGIASMLQIYFAVALLTLFSASGESFTPPACPKSTPGPTDPSKCPLKAPNDTEFATICHPGAEGHAGGAESPVNRCGGVNYTDGVFRCACCGAPLFLARTWYPGPPGDGWPAFYGNGS